jgi:hypothetical protein
MTVIRFGVADLVCFQILNLKLPLPLLLVPLRVCHQMLEFHIFSSIVLVRHALDILHNLSTVGIVIGPLRVVLEEKGEARGRDVAGDARVAVFKPDTSDI